MKRKPLFEYKEFSAKEAIELFSTPDFQRATDSRVGQFAQFYVDAKRYTSEPIMIVMNPDKSYDVIDGGHRLAAFLLASERIDDIYIATVCPTMKEDPQELFMKSNKRKSLSFKHVAYINKVVVHLRNRNIQISDTATNRKAICSSDLVKMMAVYSGEANVASVISSGAKSLSIVEAMEDPYVIALACEHIAREYAEQCLKRKATVKQQALTLAALVVSKDIELTRQDYWDLAEGFESSNAAGNKKRVSESFFNIIAGRRTDSERKQLAKVLQVL